MHDSLQLVLILLTVAVSVVVVCRLLHLPVMLGYLAVGLLIGPHALAWVPDTPQARHLAEFGIVFLMFSIGLEFSLSKLRAMHRIVFGMGGAQVMLTMLGVMAVVVMVGVDWRSGVALGGVLAMSSTAIVSKLLIERAELNTPHGHKIMGVLLFQDLAVVPLLILIPALASPAGDLPAMMGLALLKAGLALSALLVFGQKLMRPWFHLVARQKSSELFMLNVLLITLGLAWMTDQAGLSLALGAFVAGVLIAETEFRYQVEEDIKPFRDVLLGLFFVTVGMMLNVPEMLQDIGWVLLVLVGFLLFKAVVVTWLAHGFGSGWGASLQTGLGLAQAGEFGFVLLTEAGDVQLLDHHHAQIVLAAMLISMLLAPFIIQHADKIVRRVSPDEWMFRAMQMHQVAVRTMGANDHVIVCGYGRSGQTLGRFLAREGIHFIALDMDSARVRSAAAAGEEVVYGDAAKREVLLAAGLMRAKVVVVSYNDKHSALRILKLVQELRPGLPVVVRTTDDAHVDILRQAGAAEVVAEVVEGSVMLATQALLMAGVSLPKVMRQLRENRAERYHAFDSYFRTEMDAAEDISDDQQSRLSSVLLLENDVAVGQRLDALKLDELGVTVNAVRRHGVRGNQPQGDMTLAAGDVLVLFGQTSALAEAARRLKSGLPAAA